MYVDDLRSLDRGRSSLKLTDPHEIGERAQEEHGSGGVTSSPDALLTMALPRRDGPGMLRAPHLREASPQPRVVSRARRPFASCCARDDTEPHAVGLTRVG